MNEKPTDGLLSFLRKNRPIQVVLPLVVCVLSLLLLRPLFTSPGFYGWEIHSLDEKKDTVTKLLMSSTSSSALLSLIPGDACSAIAEKLADLSVALTFILAVLYAEKYLMPLLGGLTTIVLIPAICTLLLARYRNPKVPWLKNIAVKLVALALACMLMIPTGIFMSDTVDRIFKYSIDSAINAALDSEQALITDIEEAEAEYEETEAQPDEDRGFLGAIGDAATSVVNTVTDTAKDVFDSISTAAQNVFTGVNTSIEIAKIYLGNFAEAIAILLITNCVIPLLVFIAFAKVVKFVFNLNFSVADTSKQAASYYKTMKGKRFKRNPDASQE